MRVSSDDDEYRGLYMGGVTLNPKTLVNNGGARRHTDTVEQ
jgi:hypothetical protein